MYFMTPVKGRPVVGQNIMYKSYQSYGIVFVVT